MKATFKKFYPPALIFAVAAFFYWYSFSFPPPRFEPMGPRFFPQCILIATMCLCVLEMGKAAYQTVRNSLVENKAGPDGHPPSGRSEETVLLLTTILFLLGFILTIVFTDIPFLLLAFVFMILLGFVLSKRTTQVIRPVLGMATGTVAAIYLVFGMILKTFFP